jgi:hypothetical protein
METATHSETHPNLQGQIEQGKHELPLGEHTLSPVKMVDQHLKHNLERMACNQQRIVNARSLAEANELRVEAVHLLLIANQLRAEAQECQHEADSFADAGSFEYEIAALRQQAADYQQKAERMVVRSRELLHEAKALRSRVAVILPQHLND